MIRRLEMTRTSKLAVLIGSLAIVSLPVGTAGADRPHPATPHAKHKHGHPEHGSGEAEHKSDDRAGHRSDHAKAGHGIAYKAKGVVKAVDANAKTLTLTVGSKKGDTNKHSRAWSGKDVVFDVAGARVKVNHDTNGDGKRDLGDVAAGDRARVLAKLPRSGPGSEPYAAKKVTVKTAEPAHKT
jgi:hypothetical protein